MGRLDTNTTIELVSDAEAVAVSCSDFLEVARGWGHLPDQKDRQEAALLEAESLASDLDEKLKVVIGWHGMPEGRGRAITALERAAASELTLKSRLFYHPSNLHKVVKVWIDTFDDVDSAERFAVKTIKLLINYFEVVRFLEEVARIPRMKSRNVSLLAAAESRTRSFEHWDALFDLHELFDADATSVGRLLVNATGRVREYYGQLRLLEKAVKLNADGLVVASILRDLDRRARSSDAHRRIAELWIGPMNSRADFDRCIALAEKRVGNCRGKIAIAQTWFSSANDRSAAEKWLRLAEFDAANCADWMAIGRFWMKNLADEQSCRACLSQAEFDAFDTKSWISIALTVHELLKDDSASRHALLRAESYAISKEDFLAISDGWAGIDANQAKVVRERSIDRAGRRWPWLVLRSKWSESSKLVGFGLVLSIFAKWSFYLARVLVYLLLLNIFLEVLCRFGIGWWCHQPFLQEYPYILSSNVIFAIVLTVIWLPSLGLVRTFGFTLARWGRRRARSDQALFRGLDLSRLIWKDTTSLMFALSGLLLVAFGIGLFAHHQKWPSIELVDPGVLFWAGIGVGAFAFILDLVFKKSPHRA